MRILYHLTHLSRSWNRLRYYWFLNFGPTKCLADLLYKNKFGHSINWESPEDLNQWINWIAFNTDTTSWIRLADKLAVRGYVEELGFQEILIPLLKVWDSSESIDIDLLPNRFVIKANNGSGDIIVCNAKSNFSNSDIQEHFKSIFNEPFGKATAEPHYLHIKPYVFAEQLLDPTKQTGKSTSLIDYKFWCFNGKVQWCFVCSDRSKDRYTTDLYDVSQPGLWHRINQYLNYSTGYDSGHIRPNQEMPKPVNLHKMIEIASKLSNRHPQMRVDLYEVDNKIYFGELTLTGASGRMDSINREGLIILGGWCKEAVDELGLKKH